MNHAPGPPNSPEPQPDDLQPAAEATKLEILATIYSHAVSGLRHPLLHTIAERVPTDNPDVDFYFGVTTDSGPIEEQFGVVGTITKSTKVGENVYQKDQYSISRSGDGTLELKHWVTARDETPKDDTEVQQRVDELTKQWQEGEINDAEIAWGIMEIRREARQADKEIADEQAEGLQDETEIGLTFVSQSEADALFKEISDLKPRHLRRVHEGVSKYGLLGLTAIGGLGGPLSNIDKPWLRDPISPLHFPEEDNSIRKPSPPPPPPSSFRDSYDFRPEKLPLSPIEPKQPLRPLLSSGFGFAKSGPRMPKNQVQTGKHKRPAKFEAHHREDWVRASNPRRLWPDELFSNEETQGSPPEEPKKIKKPPFPPLGGYR